MLYKRFQQCFSNESWDLLNKSISETTVVNLLEFWKDDTFVRFPGRGIQQRSALLYKLTVFLFLLIYFFPNEKAFIYKHLVRIKRGYNSPFTSRYSDEDM